MELQNALRYNFTLFSPARFSEFEGKNSLSVKAFQENFVA